jgi:acyl dehydratase
MSAITADDWRAWIGRTGELREAYWPVSSAAVGYYCESVRDPSPQYYAAAARRAGLPHIAPQPFVATAIRSPTWWPGEDVRHELYSLEVPVPWSRPARINASVSHRYHRPLLIGETLEFQSTILSIEPRTTRLGEGLFIDESISVTGSATPVATITNRSLVYDADAAFDPEGVARRADANRPQTQNRPPPDAPEHSCRLTFPLTLSTLVMAAGGERDFNPIHHDTAHARSVGNRAAFANTLFQLALCSRAVSEWLPSQAVFLDELSLRMSRPAYLDTVVELLGTVRAAAADGAGWQVSMQLVTADGVCSLAQATARPLQALRGRNGAPA